MAFFHKIIIVIISFNLISSLISLDNKNSQKELFIDIKSFEELDQIMSHSEFNKVWERVRTNIKNSEINEESQREFKEFRADHFKDNEEDLESIDDDILLGSSYSELDSESCLLSNEETTKLLKDRYGINENAPQDELKFIVGKCHPVILIPGMMATKLQVRIDCKGLYSEEREIFKKVKFYCGNAICKYHDKVEEHNLFITGFGSFQLLELGNINKYSACLGYFMSFFNTKDACAPDTSDKYVCNYSKNIKIGYYGINESVKNKGKCGLNAIQNVIMTGVDSMDDQVNTGLLRSYKPLIKKLEQSGYKAGFSLGGIPNDYRRFVSNNAFATNSLRYQIENLYKNTGKSVVIIAHSYGTIITLNNIIKKGNENLLPKIKKFIAVGPPFLGSTELVKKYFSGRNKYKKELNLMGQKLVASFDEFGFGMIINKLPTVFELRPQPILDKIFNDPQYKELGEAIKERLNLEKECGSKLCSDDKIQQNSVKFDSIFKGYYPSLTEPDCKYEKNLRYNSYYLTKKCITEMYNLGDCPMIIENRKNATQKIYNFHNIDNLCGKSYDNLYFPKECKKDDNRKCLDELFYTKCPYPYKENSEKTKYFIDNYKSNNFKEECGEIKDYQEYPSLKQYMSEPKKQLKFHNKISLTKDAPVPKVDTDIVFGNFYPTVTSFIYDENDYSKEGPELKKGGDGMVPNWSPLIPGLKWIYEMKKNNLKNKIRLVEFCSRLGKNSKYEFNPNEEQNFVALSCECIDNSNFYSNNIEKDCSHGIMISDKFFIKYVFGIIKDPREDNNKVTKDRINAVKNFDPNQMFERKCNEKLYDIFNSEK